MVICNEPMMNGVGMMDYKGSSVYDDDKFFDQFIARRNRKESPNNLIETPVFMELLGDVQGKKILDLGCGDGSFGIQMIEAGCKEYVGVEGSKNMFQMASDNLKGTSHRLHLSTLESFNYPVNEYDCVTSRLVIHYIEDTDTLFQQIYQTIKPNGKLVISVQHPILTSSIKSAESNNEKSNWVVDHYFKNGKRIEPWIGENVVKYHRTIEDYFNSLQKAGFIIDKLAEGKPSENYFDSVEEYNRRLRIPLFLMFSCKKV